MNFDLLGIYNIDTVRHLELLGVRDFTFDLRPRSLNFIQIKNSCDIINLSNTTKTIFSILLEDEKDFVISQTITQFKSFLKSDYFPLLTFKALNPLSFYENFNVDYKVYYSDQIDFSNTKNLKYLKSVIFTHEYLEKLQGSNSLFSFIKDFQTLIGNGVKLELAQELGKPIMESIIDFIPFNLIQFEISNLVELSYRNIDLIALNNHIEYTKKSLMLNDENKTNGVIGE